VTGFARDPDTQAYYDARAGEYDEWYEGEGKFAARDRPGWDAESTVSSRSSPPFPRRERSMSPVEPVS
jgi:hypothetical protein